MFNRLRTLIDTVVVCLIFAGLRLALGAVDINLPAPIFVVIAFIYVGVRAGQQYVVVAGEQPDSDEVKAFSWIAAFDSGAVQLILSFIGAGVALVTDPDIAAEFAQVPFAFTAAIVVVLSVIFYFVGVFILRVFIKMGATAAMKKAPRRR